MNDYLSDPDIIGITHMEVVESSVPPEVNVVDELSDMFSTLGKRREIDDIMEMRKYKRRGGKKSRRRSRASRRASPDASPKRDRWLPPQDLRPARSQAAARACTPSSPPRRSRRDGGDASTRTRRPSPCSDPPRHRRKRCQPPR